MENALKATEAAAERFFRQYYKHCSEPDNDTLFNLLNAAHSFNDKLSKSHSVGFFSIAEFAAVKALRNIFHHEGELVHEVRIIPADKLPPISTDLVFLCLIPSKLIGRAIKTISTKYRSKEERSILSVVHTYGEVSNINPCLFNFAVKVYELVASLNINVSGEDFREIEQSYKFEIDNGHNHYVSGKIFCSAGDCEEVIRVAFANIT